MLLKIHIFIERLGNPARAHLYHIQQWPILLVIYEMWLGHLFLLLYTEFDMVKFVAYSIFDFK